MTLYKDIDPYQLGVYINSLPIVEKSNISYINASCAFDIETSSFYDNGQKSVVVYEWQFGIEDVRVYGRTLDSFVVWLRRVMSYVDKDKLLVCYVHNLSYEFQFLYKYFTWTKVFARHERKPMRAVADKCIEFRCSYTLTHKSLHKVGEDLNPPIIKLDAEYNYTEVRTPYTPLTDLELQYGETDIDIVIGLIRQKIQEDGDITQIPLTMTGYVRRSVRAACFADPKYKSLMYRLHVTADEYGYLKAAFSGGFTHANSFHTGKVRTDVKSKDLASAYPAAMLMQTFPMDAGVKLSEMSSPVDVKALCRTHHVIMAIDFYNIRTRWRGDNIISSSRCIEINGGSPAAAKHGAGEYMEDNGRVVKADSLRLVCTEIDLAYIKKFYKYDRMEVLDGYAYRRAYLPDPIRREVVEYFRGKTEFKDVPGKEFEYAQAKGNLNSLYGMIVTEIVTPDVRFNSWENDWTTENAAHMDIEKKIDGYNKAFNRFLFYPWGVYVTAYTRARVWSAILECGDDYLYSDTDSVKIINADKHEHFFREQNAAVIEALHQAADDLGLDYDYITPRGKTLGTWENDGDYLRFKTLGAKRYMYEYWGKDEDTGESKIDIKITIAGCSKKDGGDYIKSKDDPFSFFEHDMHIPAKHSGRLTHTYIDEYMTGTVLDRDGNEYPYRTLSGVHMEPAPYSMTLSKQYLDLLYQIQVDTDYILG